MVVYFVLIKVKFQSLNITLNKIALRQVKLRIRVFILIEISCLYEMKINPCYVNCNLVLMTNSTCREQILSL